ncbi:hypothetical protein HWV62_18564 [Athelia sp. TMB]|nr:hypothetical protein HWV62_18564 [Athelia sp. TMB]
MSTFSGPPLDFNLTVPRQIGFGEDIKQDLKQARREIELLKTMDPFRAAEMSLEIQMERMRVTEAISARDNVVKRLVDAHVSIRQKVAVIDRLEAEQIELRRKLFDLKGLRDEAVEEADTSSNPEIERLQRVIDGLRDEVKSLKEFRLEHRKNIGDPPPGYEVNSAKVIPSLIEDVRRTSSETSEPSRVPFRVLRNNSATSIDNLQSNASNVSTPNPHFPLASSGHRISPDDTEHMMTIRHAILAALPIPIEIPMDDALSPVNIPPPFTLHEFLGTTTGTDWRAPITALDSLSLMESLTECFYNKDGKWYYAGIYTAFRLEDLTIKEWEALSDETTQLLVKETLAARKNTSPQNHYEVSQLYAAGALKIACVGLQCVGFNNALYRTICTQTAKWDEKATISAGNSMGSVTSLSSTSGSAFLSASESLPRITAALDRATNCGRREIDENVPE